MLIKNVTLLDIEKALRRANLHGVPMPSLTIRYPDWGKGEYQLDLACGRKQRQAFLDNLPLEAITQRR